MAKTAEPFGVWRRKRSHKSPPVAGQALVAKHELSSRNSRSGLNLKVEKSSNVANKLRLGGGSHQSAPIEYGAPQPLLILFPARPNG